MRARWPQCRHPGRAQGARQTFTKRRVRDASTPAQRAAIDRLCVSLDHLPPGTTGSVQGSDPPEPWTTIQARASRRRAKIAPSPASVSRTLEGSGTGVLVEVSVPVKPMLLKSTCPLLPDSTAFT